MDSNGKKGSAAAILLVGLLCGPACGKSLSQMLFAPSADQRTAESLSADLTPPAAITLANPDEFSFAVFADVQVRDEQKTLLGRFKTDVDLLGLDFFVVLGDLTEDGSIAQLTYVKQALDGVGVPYYATIGNHDLFQVPEKGGWAGWKSTFGPATYAVTLSDRVRFLFIDTASGDLGSTQFNWLEEQLALPTSARFTFVGSHYPVYDGITPLMWRLGSVEERYKLSSLLNRSNVYAFVAGHLHTFESAQVGQVRHFITGSMYPYELDGGEHGYLLFNYKNGEMTSRHVVWDDVPKKGFSATNDIHL